MGLSVFEKRRWFKVSNILLGALVVCRVLKHHMRHIFLTMFTSKRNGGVANKKVGVYQENKGGPISQL